MKVQCLRPQLPFIHRCRSIAGMMVREVVGVDHYTQQGSLSAVTALKVYIPRVLLGMAGGLALWPTLAHCKATVRPVLRPGKEMHL